ncbi:hypothetical protein FD754_022550, partial [Muntiacus muntjak]
NLGNNGNRTELEGAFGYYGPLRSVWVARNSPGFAFVESEDPPDAADAVPELDGREHCVKGEKGNDYRRRSPPPPRRSPRRRSFSRSQNRALSRDKRRERSLSHSRSRSNERK